MRYLITGGAGFIGGALVRKLIINDRNVVFNLDKLGYASDLESIDNLNLKNNFGNYTFINVDLVDKENLRDAIEKANHDLYAFQSSIFTNNLDSAMQSFEKLQAKSVFINEQTAFRVDWMPFGGIKHSGEGVGGIDYTFSDLMYDKLLIINSKKITN